MKTTRAISSLLQGLTDGEQYLRGAGVGYQGGQYASALQISRSVPSYTISSFIPARARQLVRTAGAARSAYG